MELREQAYILAIAKHGNLKLAAEELHISSSALSLSVSTLEKNIGLPLFDRIGKSFVPTRIGELYITHATEMIEIRQRYEEELAALRNDSKGTIRLGMHPRRTLHLLPRIMVRKQELYPDIEILPVEDSSDGLLEGLQKGTLDLIITNTIAQNPNIRWHKLYKDDLVIVLSKDHPAIKHAVPVDTLPLPVIDLAYLKNETFLLQKPFQASRRIVDQIMRDQGFTPRKNILIENMETASQMAAEGLGVAFNYRLYHYHFHYGKETSAFLYSKDQKPIVYYTGINEKRYHPACHYAMLELLASVAADVCNTNEKKW